MARYTGGWIKLHRKILKSWVGKDANALSIMVTLVCWANRKPGSTPVNGQLKPLGRGQLVTSSREVGEQLALDRKTVERKLSLMEKDGILSQEVSRHGRLITLIKYVVYQDSKKKMSHDQGHGRGHDGATVGATVGPHSGEVENSPYGENNRNKNPQSRAPAHARVDPQTAQLLGAGLAKRAEGAIRKNLTATEAKGLLGPEAWAMIDACYTGWEDFVGAFREAYRTAAAPTVVTAQLRDAFAADILLRGGH